MYNANLEIYDDTSNFTVVKHPGRVLPGSLIQGDTLYSLCTDLDRLCEELKKKRHAEALNIAKDIRDYMWMRLNHYQAVLEKHEIPLPFSRI